MFTISCIRVPKLFYFEYLHILNVCLPLSPLFLSLSSSPSSSYWYSVEYLYSYLVSCILRWPHQISLFFFCLVYIVLHYHPFLNNSVGCVNLLILYNFFWYPTIPKLTIFTLFIVFSPYLWVIQHSAFIVIWYILFCVLSYIFI